MSKHPAATVIVTACIVSAAALVLDGDIIATILKVLSVVGLSCAVLSLILIALGYAPGGRRDKPNKPKNT